MSNLRSMAALFVALAIAHGLTVAAAIAREPAVTAEKPARIVFEKKSKKAKKARAPAGSAKRSN